MPRRRRGGGSRDYPRTVRVNELLREIIADELERLDEPELEWISITGVEVNPELTSAEVFFSSLEGPESDAAVLEALGSQRVRLQRAIARQARLRRTPELRFAADVGVRSGQRVEELLSGLVVEDDPAATGDDGALDEADSAGGPQPGADPR